MSTPSLEPVDNEDLDAVIGAVGARLTAGQQPQRTDRGSKG